MHFYHVISIIIIINLRKIYDGKRETGSQKRILRSAEILKSVYQ